jgi:hypothetical protein
MFVQLRPTYQSVYPVAQGILLALGTGLFHHPWWGVWIGMGFFTGALCWMLQGWLPPVWALLGTSLAVLQFAITSYWMNSYWGGAAGAAGGAILLGVWPRMVRQPSAAHGIILATGLVLLANTRPWEGFLLACAVMCLLALDLRAANRPLSLRMVVPGGVILACAAIAMCWYFWRVTGNPFVMPYQLAFREYAAGGMFFWDPIRHPVYRHEVLERFYTALAASSRADYSSLIGIARMTIGKLYAIAGFYVGPLVFCVLAMLPALVRNTRTAKLLLCFAAVFAGLFASVHLQLHYASPVASLLVLAGTHSLRRFWLLKRRGWVIGAYLIPAMFLMMLGSALTEISNQSRPLEPSARSKILTLLLNSKSKHLVFVRYAANHPFEGEEWVYNDADIQNSRVIWARDMGEAGNLQLSRSFPDRKAWKVEPDIDPTKLMNYP